MKKRIIAHAAIAMALGLGLPGLALAHYFDAQGNWVDYDGSVIAPGQAGYPVEKKAALDAGLSFENVGPPTPAQLRMGLATQPSPDSGAGSGSAAAPSGGFGGASADRTCPAGTTLAMTGPGRMTCVGSAARDACGATIDGFAQACPDAPGGGASGAQAQGSQPAWTAPVAQQPSAQGGSAPTQSGGTWATNPNGWASSDPAPSAGAPEGALVVSGAVPGVSRSTSELNALLICGVPGDQYTVENNAWGQGSIPNGGFSQSVGAGTGTGGNPGGSARLTWDWPQGTTEVKGYPAIISGNKPGYAGNQGGLPSVFPMQLPLASLKAEVNYHNITQPSGQGHLSFDIWLQSSPNQTTGWVSAPITHEIMIPLENWGGYGSYPNNRNPAWYDHDAMIGGKLYHVYVTKDPDGGVRPNFGGAPGWKMIAFVPDVMPVAPGTIDIASFINYLPTRRDAFGTPWANGNEYIVDVELGVEPVVGNGDIAIDNFKITR